MCGQRLGPGLETVFFLQTLTVDVVPIVDLPSATLLGGGESVFCDWLVCVEYVWGGGSALETSDSVEAERWCNGQKSYLGLICVIWSRWRLRRQTTRQRQ